MGFDTIEINLVFLSDQLTFDTLFHLYPSLPDVSELQVLAGDKIIDNGQFQPWVWEAHSELLLLEFLSNAIAWESFS